MSDRFHGAVVAQLAAVPAGQKLAMSVIARTLDCSVSVLATTIEALIEAGRIDGATLRPPVVPKRARPKRQRGENEMLVSAGELLGEIRRFLAATGMAKTQFGKRAVNDANFVKRLEDGTAVRNATIAKVRSFIADPSLPTVSSGRAKRAPPRARQRSGVVVPARAYAARPNAATPADPVPSRTAPTAPRSDAAPRPRVVQPEPPTLASIEAEQTRQLITDAAPLMPTGEFRAARSRGEERTFATPSALIRRAQKEWPSHCASVASVAVQLGVGLGDAWQRVISAGIDCLKEADA